MSYQRQHTKWMTKAGVQLSDLPADLNRIIHAFETALYWFDRADSDRQSDYRRIIEQTDAYISVRIYNMFKDKIEKNQSNKTKLLALRAKALNINLNEE